MATIDNEAGAYPFGQPERLIIEPGLARLRAEQPVLRVRMPYGGEAWLVTRYADIKTVLADPRFSRAAATGRAETRATGVQAPSSSILSTDPPEHSRLRRLVAQAFTARRIELLRPSTQQIVDDLLDTMIAEGPSADIAEAVAWPLPIRVICDLLGVPEEDRDRFHALTDDLLVFSADPAHANDSWQQLRDYIAGLAARRRAEPTDDLLGVLVKARDDGDRLSEEELVSFGSFLLAAGHETTANQTGNFLYTLLTNRHCWEELVAQPDLVPAAIEELSRITPLESSTLSVRIATEDLELGSTRIKAGEAVTVVLASANRDADVFEHPDEIDFHRASNPHLAFGHGVHHCLGAQLARMELETAIATLVRRLPSLRLATPADDVPWRTDRVLRGVAALPVTWDATQLRVGL
jgi:cytochrome P450